MDKWNEYGDPINSPESMAMVDFFSILLFVFILVSSALILEKIYSSDDDGSLPKDEAEELSEENKELVSENLVLKEKILYLGLKAKELNEKILDLKGRKIIIPNRLKGKVFFDTSKSTIKEEFIPILDEYYVKIEKEISNGNYNHVQIVGHTDAVPINTAKYEDNWDLGAARAASVVRYFLKKGMDEKILSVRTYAEHRPSNPERSGKKDKRNPKDRRIEIVLLKM